MANSTAPVPASTDAARRTRTRWALGLTGVALLLGMAGLAAYTGAIAQRHEERVIAGDYANVRFEAAPAEVQESGEVVEPDRQVVDLEKPQRFVASLKLTPPGRYQAVLLADDGIEAHRKKSEMVIAAQDDHGAWHPASAAEVLTRLKVPTPGAPR